MWGAGRLSYVGQGLSQLEVCGVGSQVELGVKEAKESSRKVWSPASLPAWQECVLGGVSADGAASGPRMGQRRDPDRTTSGPWTGWGQDPGWSLAAVSGCGFHPARQQPPSEGGAVTSGLQVVGTLGPL